MKNNYLTDLLEPIVDADHLNMAEQIDDHIHGIWDNAPPVWEQLMNNFEAKRGENPEAEFVLMVALTKAMLEK